MPNLIVPAADRRIGFGLILLALAVRVGVVLWKADQLTIDRDAYLGLAENLVAGRGFCTPGTTTPTAFRPPLYPLLLSAGVTILPTAWAVAVVNVVAGVVTVWLTDRLGRTLNCGTFRHVAALLLAVDPLLLNATPQPMTEVVFTLLTTAWLWAVICLPKREGRFGREFLIGIAFGLAALCRPTIWPLAGLMGLAWLLSQTTRTGSRISPLAPAPGERVRERGEALRATHNFLLDSESPSFHRRLWSALPVIAGTLLLVLPWVARNQLVFGTPIVMTTHGGYTLLLANNPVYDREVIQQPWGTVWSGEGLARWQSELEERLHAEIGPHPTELQRDAWMSAEAKRFIRQHPDKFLSAMFHRIRSLWSIAPRGEGGAMPAAIRTAVALFYAAVYLLAALGAWYVIRKNEWPAWLPMFLLIATIQGVHLIYWTDARMRSPVEPVLALLAARALCGRNVREQEARR